MKENMAVLISIRPRWLELISSGKKQLEIRKTRPKVETPFKVYIYCTQPNTSNPHEILEIHSSGKIHKMNGKVIGEFVCDEIRVVDVPFPAFQDKMDKDILKQSCLTYHQLHNYAGHHCCYGWHISDLVIYDKPKELSDFRHCGENYHFNPIITRPPQSWCYVENNEEAQNNVLYMLYGSEVK